MARPIKQGLDYFPVDIQFDDKMELLIAENGSDSISIMITVWQLIYQNGYFVGNGEDLFFMVRRRTMLDIKTIEKVINSAIKRKLFDSKIHKEYNILTSKAIQRRYLNATSRRERVNVNRNYLLVSVDEYKNIELV